MPFSLATRDNFVNHITRKASWTMPADLFLSFVTADPGSDGSNIGGTATEPSEGNFVRLNISGTDFATVAAGSTTTDNLLQWIAADADWAGGVVLTRLMCMASNGHGLNTAPPAADFLWYSNAFALPQAVRSIDVAKILSGQLSLSMT